MENFNLTAERNAMKTDKEILDFMELHMVTLHCSSMPDMSGITHGGQFTTQGDSRIVWSRGRSLRATVEQVMNCKEGDNRTVTP